MSRAGLVWMVALSGCYLSHELGDGGVPRDPPRDAAPADLRPDAARVDAFVPPDLGADSGTDLGVDAPPVCPFGWDDTVEARIVTTTDDAFTLYVNGSTVGTNDDWHLPQTYTVTLHRHPGRANAIAIEGRNVMTIAGRDRGVVLDLRATVGGAERVLISGLDWRTGPDTAGWLDETFDDSGWARAVDEGAYGDMPWGAVLGVTTPARWIWTYDSSLPVGSKPFEETVHVRRAFYFDVSGAVSDVATPCP